VSYLFSHCVIEFLRNVWLDFRCDFQRPKRVDAPLLHWLLATLEAEQSDDVRDRDVRSPHRLHDPTELWIWKHVAGAYALLIGSVRPLRVSLDDDGHARMAYAARRPRQLEAYDFMQDLLAKWEEYIEQSALSDPRDDMLWKVVVEKIEWLDTSEGLELVREVCSDMDSGDVILPSHVLGESVGCHSEFTVCLHCPGVTPKQYA
jgi:hypothetical protein